MSKQLLLCLFLLHPVAASTVWGNDFYPANGPSTGIHSKVSSVFIYQFTKYILWPQASSQGDFVIGVVGEAALSEELKRLAQQVKVGGQRTIAVKKISPAEINSVLTCHIIYVPETEKKQLKSIAQTVDKAPVLVVSEGFGLAQKGSQISLYIDEDDNKVKFELNKQQLQLHQLQVSSDLLKLAAAVL